MEENKNDIEYAEYVVFYFGVGLGMFGVVATILDIMGLI